MINIIFNKYRQRAGAGARGHGKRRSFKKARTLCACAAAAMFLMTSCAPAATGENHNDIAQTGKSGDGLKIVTTIFAPYDFARQITAGTDADINMLLAPGTEVHSYDPTVQDIVEISECDLFIYTGGENDEWVNDILESLDHPINTLKMMDHSTKVEEEVKEGMQSVGHDHDHEGHSHEEAAAAHGDVHEHDHESEDLHYHDAVHEDDDEDHDSEYIAEDEDMDDHEHEAEWDEHVWTSPRNAETIVSAIAEELCELDAENAAVYHNNLSSYLTQLEELDENFRKTVSSAQNKTMIFADRFPVRYFTEEYGLDYFAAYPGCAADAEPSAATIRFLIDRVRDENINAVFYIEMSNEKMADTVCAETGAQKLLFHSCHNVTKDEMENGATYISIMNQNLENLKTALFS